MTTFDEAAGYLNSSAQGSLPSTISLSLNNMTGFASTAFENAITAINNLVTVPDPTYEAPTLDDSPFNYTVVGQGTVTPPSLLTVGSINIAGMPSAGNIAMASAGAAPTWVSPLDLNSIVMPQAPAPIDFSGMPAQPPVNLSVTMPGAFTGTAPTMAALVPIQIPTFPDLTIPTYSGVQPGTFTTAPPALLDNWSEPAYVPEVMNQILPVIQSMLNGVGLPNNVLQALFAKAAEKEDITMLQATETAYETWASRGFTMPPGMLVQQVNAAQQQALLSKNSLNRDILTKQWDIQMENLKFSITQGLAFEAQLISIYNNMLQRTFDMSRTRIESAIKLYDMSIAIYNANVSAYKINADVYRNLLEAELSKLDIYKAQLEGQRLIGEENQIAASVYGTQVNAFNALVQAYKTQIDVVQAQVEVAKTQIDAYKVEVEAWSEKIGAQKVAFDAYATEVSAEETKVNLVKAAADAYAAEVGGYSALVSANAKMAEVQVEVFDAQIKGYNTQIEAETAQVNASIAVNKNLIEQYLANIDLYKVNTNVALENARNQTTLTEMRLRNNIAFFDAQLKEYEVLTANFFKKVELNNTSMQHAAQVAGQIASGALSSIHVSTMAQNSQNLSVGFNESFSSTPTSA